MYRVSFGILENPWLKVSSRAGDSLRVFAQFAPGYCNLGDASLSGLWSCLLSLNQVITLVTLDSLPLSPLLATNLQIVKLRLGPSS